jgi:hypothetical protein
MKMLSSRKMGLCALIVLVAALCAAPAMAGDVTVYTNLGSGQSFNNNGGWTLGTWYNGANQAMASPFTPTTTTNLADALLAVTYFGGDNPPLDVYLESDNSGQPGAVLTTLTQQGGTLPAFGSSGPVTTFTCTTCPLMDAGSTYWLVAVQPDPDSLQTWNNVWNSATGPLAFNETGSNTGPWSTFTGDMDAFEVDGTTTTTPEPVSMLLMGTFLSLAGGLLSKKKRGL